MAHGGAVDSFAFDPTLDLFDEPVEGRVSCIMVTALPALARAQGATVDDLLAGTGIEEETLADISREISWSSYVQLLSNCTRIWPPGGLEKMGERLVRSPSARIIFDLARSLDNPVEMFQLLVGSVRHAGFSIVNQRLEVVSPRSIQIEYRVPRGYVLSREFCEIQKGYHAAVPTTMGLSKAHVDFIATDTSVLFEIRLAGFRNPISKLWYSLRRRSNFLVTRSRLDEVIQQLNNRYDVANRHVQILSEQISRNKIVEERFTRCFDAAPAAMLICRASDYSVVDVNEQLVDSTGYSREEVLAWTPAQMTIWANPTEREIVHSAAAETEGSIEGRECTLRHRDGNEIVALVSSKPVKLDGEDCILWQAIDITARKNSERELRCVRDHFEDLVEERTRELHRSLDALHHVQRLASVGTLAAGIAHEINNPLASIRAASEFALMFEDEPDAVANYRQALETCVEQSRRCGEIVRNIRRFSRGETGIRIDEDLRAIVIRSMQLVYEYASTCGGDIHSDICDDEIPVFVNPIEMEQVFVNVLRNAIEANEGKTRIEVIIRRLATGGFVEIRDDGPGIERAQIPFLFDPFYTTRQGEGGTGLGLSVAHGIVTAHGGAIRADSEVDHGTAIQIQIPLHGAPSP